jgi:hypothetical protein
VGTIGNNHGMYIAHLHFEIRKNLCIGINRSAFAKDFTNYFRPSQFIAQHRRLPGSGQTAPIPINTYKTDVDGFIFPESNGKPLIESMKSKSKNEGFRVNRFEELDK